MCVVSDPWRVVCTSFLTLPMRYVPPFEDAFKDYIKANYPADKHPSPKVRPCPLARCHSLSLFCVSS